MNRVTSVALAAVLLGSSSAAGQAKRYSLESADGLVLHNVKAEPATLEGKKGLRLTIADAARPRLPAIEQLAVVRDLEFSNGAIEVELAGTPQPGAAEGARGFVGIAFRLQNEETYDAFYLRPTNGRADDQERRNHSVQYVSHPAWPWPRLRQETPGKYESYVDLVPGQWTAIKIDVRGDRARLYVHGNAQPTLIVNDVKTGAQGKGSVALWVGPGTIAHFRNLIVTP